MNNFPISFQTTDNMKKAGISDLSLNKEFIIKFDNGGMCSVSFARGSDSTSKIMIRIKRGLEKRLEQDYREVAFQDIERQLIEQQDKIFSAPSAVEDEYKSEYLERVTELKKAHEASFTFEDWQKSVQEKYENLRTITEKNFPESWPLLQFCLAAKTILNIDGCTLPFMGVILAPPSSMKTLVIQLFRKYPNSIYSDSFTPNSFESHNASLSEEELQKIDLLPKLNNRLFLTPELAPVFTTNDDDLRRSLGIITRILDGHGLETDSGAQGHRRYGNINFVWIGAAVEIPYRVWRLLGTLGHKIYMFRPVIHEKSIEELKKIARKNDFQKKFNEIQDSLMEYLISIAAAPTDSNISIENGKIRVKWDENKSDEQDQALQCLAQVANLLRRLRGTVYVSESKGSRYNNYVKPARPEDNNDVQFVTSDNSDYDTDYPIIEDASRAVELLRNLALGSAISQGRNHINLDDIPLIIDVALSTTTRARSEIIKLLLKNNGELTTAEIVKENKVSATFAKKTMRELTALGIVDISTVGSYDNSELRITLKEEYSWFKGNEFNNLFNKHKRLENNSSGEVAQNNTTELADHKNDRGSCDQSHADLESRIGTHIKNCDDIGNKNLGDTGPESNPTSNEDIQPEQKINASLWGSGMNQHVTVTQSEDTNHNLTLNEVLKVIKEAEGVQISFNAAIKSAWTGNHSVRAYLGEKLTSRENKRVRKLAEIFRHDNIEVVKTRPEIILRWMEVLK